jgi:pimeloyl-ACP methyl ester carboxylesterase
VKIHLLHGIHTEEGDNTVANLSPHLSVSTNLSVIYHRYGYASAFTTRALNPLRAETLAREVSPGDIAVGHSNGACLIWMMAKDYGCRFSGVVLINPALDEDKGFSKESVSHFIHVYYNGGDKAVSWAEFFFGHPWGQMGKIGYTGNDDRVRNYDCFGNDHDKPAWGHSDIFTKLNYWGPFIGKQIKNELEAMQIPEGGGTTDSHGQQTT